MARQLTPAQERRPLPVPARSGSYRRVHPKSWGQTDPFGIRRTGALVASAARVERRDDGKFRRLQQAWQDLAFALYDQLGEIHFAAGFYSRGISKLRLFAAEVDEQGELKETTDQTAIDVLDRIKDPGGGRERLLWNYGTLMFLVGECYLLWTKGEGDDEETWEIVSTRELRVDGDGHLTRYRAPSIAPEQLIEPPDDEFEPLPGSVIPYRLWNQHPTMSWMPDSPMVGVLELCQELLLLNRSIRAQARTRLVQGGMMLMPEEVSPAPAPAVADEDPMEDPLMEDIAEAISTPMDDEDAVSGFVPIMVRGPGEALKNLRLLRFFDPAAFYQETGLRNELREAIGIGLDMPKEALLGLTGTNHWNAWMIDDQTWKTHLRPVAQGFADNITAAYYWPALAAEGVTDFRRFVVGFDPAEIVTNPDQTASANEAYDRRAIGKQALRRSHGYTDDDAMTDDEIAEALIVATHQEVAVVNGVIIGPTRVSDTSGTPADAAEPGAPASAGTPPADQGQGTPQSAPPEPNLEAMVAGAAESAVERARELAGSRLMNHLQENAPEAFTRARQVGKADVAYTIGSDALIAAQAPEAAVLVAGAGELFARTAVRLGVQPKLAVALGELIEQHAARSLYARLPMPLPPGFLSVLRRG